MNNYLLLTLPDSMFKCDELHALILILGGKSSLLTHIKNAYWDCKTNKIYGFYGFCGNSEFSHTTITLKTHLKKQKKCNNTLMYIALCNQEHHCYKEINSWSCARYQGEAAARKFHIARTRKGGH